MRSVLAFLVFAALTLCAASFGAMFRPGPWYEALVRPSWTPPNWVFGPAWTALYVLIAIAGWRVWMARGMGPAVALWLVALVLNGAWSYIMFGAHEIAFAAVDIVALLVVILAFIVVAWRVDRVAAWLFVPYAAWVSYATSLNLGVWYLN